MSKQIGYKTRQLRWSTAAVLVLIISLAGAACSPGTTDAPSQAPPATQAAVPTAAPPTAAPPTAAPPTAAPTLAAPTLAPTASPAPSSTTLPAPTHTPVPAVTPGPEAQALIGKFTSGQNLIAFNDAGYWQIAFDGAPVDHGTFTVAGDQLTFYDVDELSCAPYGPGVYRWVVTGDKLLLTLVEDKCDLRAQFMLSAVWTKF